MQNFTISKDNKDYLVSRSVVVTTGLIAIEDQKLYVLATRSTEALKNKLDTWCLPTKYLEYDEDINTSGAKALLTTSNIQIPSDILKIIGINSNPIENKQDVTIKVCSFIKDRLELTESEEYSTSSWIPVDSISDIQWEFNHQYIIAEILTFGKQLLDKQKEEGEKQVENTDTQINEEEIEVHEEVDKD